ncbi:PREDICTED: TBC1 domain family member 15 isoform X3 [Cercocebus atys]|uniref:TBC1 domain family member 15 isoform X3 n=1 Tax=Cercocebus atys TaxID=9531 RepID=UPI0005F50FCE|nr:PREDICTED: TBC1 domain family member 15 isoform X3 [Cercocebus atys]
MSMKYSQFMFLCHGFSWSLHSGSLSSLNRVYLCQDGGLQSGSTDSSCPEYKLPIIYEQEGVYIHSSFGKTNDQDSLISGILRVLEKDAEVIVDWRPLDDALDSSSILYARKDSSSVVEWTQAPKERGHRGSEHLNSYEAEWDMVNTVSFKRKPHTNGDAPSHRNGKSKWSFLFSLTDLKSIKQNKEGMGWSYLVFCLKDDVVLPALHFHQGDSKLLIESLEKYVVLCESPQDKRTLLVNCQNKSLSQSFENLLDEPTYGLIQAGLLDRRKLLWAIHHWKKIKKDPYTATMIGFSKVTNYIFDSLRGSDPSTHQRPPSEMADFLSDAISGLKINQQEEPGFEVITRIDLGERPVVQRKEPVSLEEWTKNIDSEGRILNVDSMKQMIFRGGLSHALRKQAWKFLLGYFPWDSTKEERTQLQKQKTDEYFRMKLQWKSVSQEQEKRNSRLRDYRSLIGYVQGMSDLLSPLLYVMENEVDAFWCFASYMDQMHQNFEEQMQGMKTQLIQLSTLLRLLDSGFCSYLESQDSGYLYFCFRWLLIRFKREFSFLDILRLWEVMWTELPCKNFHLLLCCAILESEKQQIMEKHYGFNEILKHINELSMKIDVEDILCKAEAISLQMVKCKELPQAVCEILGLQDSEVTTPDSDIGEDENVVMTPRPTSAFQSNALPTLSASGARDDSPTQIPVSSDVCRLTPA